MALEDMQSQYGPFNKKGKRGTGESSDQLALEGEGNLGQEGTNSKYKSVEKNGTPEKPMSGLLFENNLIVHCLVQDCQSEIRYHL